MDVNDPIEARRELIVAANLLREAILKINEFGDVIDRRLACGGPGYALGYASLALGEVLRALFPDEGVKDRAGQIANAMVESGTTVEEAAQYVADSNAPMYGHSTTEIRDELGRMRAYLVGLNDGVVDPLRLIGGDHDDPTAAARVYLDEQIAECLAALAYRNEPEVATDA